jgi:ketosteroid isomerase-like protein
MPVPPDPSIEVLYASWRDAIRRKDVDAVFGLLSPDYLLYAPNAAPMGLDQLRPRLTAALALYDIEPSFERDEQIVSGDLAFERGWDVQTIRPLTGGPVQIQRQRVFLVLKKGDDGRWRFARGMSQPGPTP